MKIRVAPFVFPLVLALAAVATPSEVSACGNSMRHRIHKPTKTVRKAEQLLAKGKFEKAADMVRELQPTVHHYQHGDTSGTWRRAQRVAALAIVRSGGKVDLGPKLSGRSQDAKQVKLAWAMMALDVQTWFEPDDLVLRTQLAEALAANEIYQARAYDMLKDLADRDLMPTARGYALLAQLEDQRGNNGESEAAQKRCKQIAGAKGDCAWS